MKFTLVSHWCAVFNKQYKTMFYRYYLKISAVTILSKKRKKESREKDKRGEKAAAKDAM